MSSKLAKRYAGQSGAVKYKILQHGPEGSGSLISIQVDYEQAAVPDHYYVADTVQVLLLGSVVLLLFGKLDTPDVTGLRNKLEVYFPANTFLNQLWASSRRFHDMLRQFAKDTNAEPFVDASKVDTRCGQVRTIHSNNVMMALGGGETIMDFFYLSPKELWVKPRRGEEIIIEPLVRVMLQPIDLLGMLDDCAKIVDDVRRLVHPSMLALGDEDHENLESR